MGNLVSCSNLPAPMMMKAARVARVILPGGEVRQFRHPVKAAELMFESPNYFVANSRSLNMGRRFSALSADEELEFGNVYVMFPMRRVNSLVTAADMAAVLMAGNTAGRRIAGGKVEPAPAAPAPAVEGQGEDCDRNNGRWRLNSEHGIEGFEDMEYRFRLGSCKSRKPLLETITEEPFFTR